MTDIVRKKGSQVNIEDLKTKGIGNLFSFAVCDYVCLYKLDENTIVSLDITGGIIEPEETYEEIIGFINQEVNDDVDLIVLDIMHTTKEIVEAIVNFIPTLNGYTELEDVYSDRIVICKGIQTN